MTAKFAVASWPEDHATYTVVGYNIIYRPINLVFSSRVRNARPLRCVLRRVHTRADKKSTFGIGQYFPNIGERISNSDLNTSHYRYTRIKIVIVKYNVVKYITASNAQ